MLGNNLLDNSTDAYQVGHTIRQLLLNPQFSEVSIATGYWDLPGMSEIYDELASFLDRDGTALRILLGEEPSVRAYQVKNPVKQDPLFPQSYLKRDLEDIELRDEFRRVAALLEKHLSPGTGKIVIRTYKKNFLHAKCYLFGSVSENAVGLIGSSNFTRQGLFGNLELNQLETNSPTVNFVRLNAAQHPSHRSWFEELWNESEEWTRTFREEIISLSKHGGTCFSPYEMYIHALYRVYDQDLQDEKDVVVDNDDPSGGKPRLVKFQVENANSLIKKLDRQSVAMLSDSVGLGKTYTAIKVVEYYKSVKNQRVVIIAPAGLVPQWTKAFGDFKMVHVPEIYSLQDTEKIKDVKENLKSIPVGLFVFDESHNLKAANGQRFQEFINWRIENPNAHTLLLTATPINNQLHDLTNQIMLGSGGDIYRLGRFFDRTRQKSYTLKERLDLIQQDVRRQMRETQTVNYQLFKDQLTPLLNRFIVRRTRQGIEKEYPEGLEINGKLQRFPKSYPDNLEYKVPNQFRTDLIRLAEGMPELTEAYQMEISSLAELEYLAHPLDLFNHYTRRESEIQSSLEVVYSGLLSLGFPCYRYTIYRYAYYGQKRTELDLNTDQNRELSRQIGIYGIFRTVFLKRLESSLFSIHKSLGSYEAKLLDFREKLEKLNKIISVKNLAALNKAMDQYSEENAAEDELDFDIESFEQNESDFVTIPADPGTYNISKLKQDIERDLKIVGVLREQVALLIRKDDKIAQLASFLNSNEDKKVLVFTYFADTLEYLKSKLPGMLLHGRNVEFAIGNKSEIEDYARRFAPIAKRYELKAGNREIDYLLATDKLSEGQNLQDCGIIVNYDLHWNPVRMIQRNGRINRLGTAHQEIYIYNFRPTDQLESYLQLVRKLQDKINLIRYTIGSDQSVLDEEPIPQDFTEDLYSRDEKKRLAAFQKIFETSELLAAENLFMDDLREFDRSDRFTPEYKDQIRNLPKGKWGRVMRRKEEDSFTHLAHLIDGGGQSGYFFTFNEHGMLDMLSTAEGLLHIKATSEENERFRDVFRDKPETEKRIHHALKDYQVEAGDELNPLNASNSQALAYVIDTMTQYGYAPERIARVFECGHKCQNAYINKQFTIQLRAINRLLRNNKHVDSALFDDLDTLAATWNPEEVSERPPIDEVIQIFC
jgi:superfamily II DNA or RNA helicase